MKAPPIFRPFFQEVIHQLAALEDPRIQAMVEAHVRENLTAKVMEEVVAGVREEVLAEVRGEIAAEVREEVVSETREAESARKDAAFHRWLEEQRAAGAEFDESNPPPISNGATNGKNGHDSSN